MEAPMRMIFLVSLSQCCWRLSQRFNISHAQSYNSCPRGVTSICLVVRLISLVGSSSSSFWIWVLTVGWDRKSFFAAFVKLRHSTTAMYDFSCLSSITILTYFLLIYRHCKNFKNITIFFWIIIIYPLP